MGISREQALECFRSDDLVGIGMEADAVRRRLHPEDVVSYTLDRAIDCSGFHEAATEAALRSIWTQIDNALALGGTGVELRNAGAVGGIERIEALLTEIKKRYPALWVHGFSAPEILLIADRSGLGLRETLARLHAAGLDSMSGDGVDLVSPPATGRCDTTTWLTVHRTAHALGMTTAASMLFGAGETPEQRVDFLEAVRLLQEDTGGFTAFVPVGYKHPQRELDGVTAVERLKTLAISRMVLENIDNVQASATGHGLKVLQMALRFGGNDAGAAGLGGTEAGSEEDLRRIIRDAGFKPVERDAAYRTMYLN